MKHYFDFNGTSGRQEYWAVSIVVVVAMVLTMVLTEIAPLLALVLLVAIIWSYSALIIRRLRDAGLSLWWFLAAWFPYISFISMIVFGCVPTKDSTPEE
tara:strand:+ start:285 stop:581 length:297 start_codon:yes stop_codon:yes gene_type:complete